MGEVLGSRLGAGRLFSGVLWDSVWEPWPQGPGRPTREEWKNPKYERLPGMAIALFLLPAYFCICDFYCSPGRLVINLTHVL